MFEKWRQFKFFVPQRGEKSFWPTTALILIVSLLFVFQNCADPLELASEDLSALNDSLPLAYDVRLDHIAYMSCSEVPIGYEPRAYFTFRAGAYYRGSGLRFSNEFLEATSSFRGGQKSGLLSQSTLNQEAYLQLAIRSASDFQQALSAGGFEDGGDFDLVLRPLDSPEIAQPVSLLDEGERIHYFGNVSGLTDKLVEGSIRFMSTELDANAVRSHFSDGGMLALTYGTEGNQFFARAPKGADPSRSVYGVGFQMDFGLGYQDGAGPRFISGIRRVMRNIREIDLQTQRPVATQWTCPAELTFMIVRSQDINNGNIPVPCITGSENWQAYSPVEQDIYLALRNVLRVEDWWIDLTNRCVVAKDSGGPSCYGDMESDQNFRINYGLASGGSVECSEEAGNYCPHYVSVCVRSQ